MPLALAGLWAGWRDPSTEEVQRTFTIVTTTPNAAMADLHDRMPVVLDVTAWDRWLSDGRAGTHVDPGELLAMLEPTDAIPLRIYPVNRYVNDVRRDGPELIEPLLTVGATPAEGTLGI
jgi:putative SOS response-associated peptidase YedK